RNPCGLEDSAAPRAPGFSLDCMQRRSLDRYARSAYPRGIRQLRVVLLTAPCGTEGEQRTPRPLASVLGSARAEAVSRMNHAGFQPAAHPSHERHDTGEDGRADRVVSIFGTV